MNFSKLGKYTVILSTIPALYVSIYPGKIVLITMLCSYILLIGMLIIVAKLQVINEKININFDSVLYVKFFLFYNLLVLMRGIYDAKSDQDWIVMFSATIPLFLVIHFSIYLAAYNTSINSLIKSFMTYGVVLSIFIFFFEPPLSIDFTKSISPIYLMIFLIPFVNKMNRIFIIFLTLISFFSDFSNRSNLINICIASVITLSFFWKKRMWVLSLIKGARIFLLSSPIVFLILGLSGVFNVFLIGDMMQTYSIETSNGNKQDLLIDSRTSIYSDVFSELKKQEAFVFGLGASGKTKTSLTEVSYADFDKIYKEGRRRTESGMLNYIQWGGMIGGLVYFLLFVKASFLGIYRSRNWFCVMLGIWVAFKGLFSFIEDATYFSVSSIFIFFAIGICMSKKIRQLDDLEIKVFFKKTLKFN
ncbi:hypothetical protein [Flavobacterium hydrophilum]|nr:hypothetical protein [Flavobacterium hydrophilum]